MTGRQTAAVRSVSYANRSASHVGGSVSHVNRSISHMNRSVSHVNRSVSHVDGIVSRNHTYDVQAAARALPERQQRQRQRNGAQAAERTAQKQRLHSGGINSRQMSSRRRWKNGRVSKRTGWKRELQFLLVIAGILSALAMAGAGVKALRARREERAREQSYAQEVQVIGESEYRIGADGPAFIIDLQDDRVRASGNEQKYIAIHYLGVPADGHSIEENGTGAHFYIYSDGTIYQSTSLGKVPWQVGTAGCYRQLHDDANNYNTIGIEMCPLCDGDSNNDKDPKWYFTAETQKSCVMLVRALMKECGIPEKNILRHGDIVSKYCPAPYITNNSYKTSWTWDEFKENVHSLDKRQVPDLPFAY